MYMYTYSYTRDSISIRHNIITKLTNDINKYDHKLTARSSNSPLEFALVHFKIRIFPFINVLCNDFMKRSKVCVESAR